MVKWTLFYDRERSRARVGAFIQFFGPCFDGLGVSYMRCVADCAIRAEQGGCVTQFCGGVIMGAALLARCWRVGGTLLARWARCWRADGAALLPPPSSRCDRLCRGVGMSRGCLVYDLACARLHVHGCKRAYDSYIDYLLSKSLATIDALSQIWRKSPRDSYKLQGAPNSAREPCSNVMILS